MNVSFLKSLVGVAAISALTALFAGCPDNPAEGEGEGEGENLCAPADPCQRNFDCGGGAICEIADGDTEGCCRQVTCLTNEDCGDNEACDARRGICVADNLCDPGTNDGCGGGDLCIYNQGAPQCVAEVDLPAPAACTVTPSPVIVHDGDAVELFATGEAANGSLVPRASFTFSSDIGTIDGNELTGACATGVCTGTVTATADNGGVTCTADVRAYAPALAADVRVSLFDARDGGPISGATVAIRTSGGTTTGTTDADGTFTFTGGAADFDAVSAFPDGHQWHTSIGDNNDVVFYTVPVPNSTVAAGVKGTFNFDNVTTVGDIRLGLAGTSISSSITDLDFDLLIGELADYTIVLEGITDPEGETVPLPSGLVLELSTSELKPEFVALGDPGKRTLWALGGKVQISDIGDIIGNVAGGGEDINIGQILGSVLPFFARFDHAVATGLDLTESARPAPPAEGVPIPYDDWNFDALDGDNAVSLNTLLSQSATYNVPTLPCTAGAVNGASCDEFASGAVMLSGVLVPGQGLVPLGLTAGLDDPDDTDDNDQADGILDYLTDEPASGQAIVDYAPPHDGLEGNQYVTIAIALDINGLTEGEFAASTQTHIAGSLDGTSDLPGAFLQQQGGTWTQGAAGAAGTFTVDAVGAADFYRLNLNEGAAEWNIWFDDTADATGLDIETLRPGNITGRTAEGLDIQAFRLGTGYDGLSPTTWDELVGFNGTNFDNLLFYMGAWSSNACVASSVDLPDPFCDAVPAQ
jgi:hypothetical protein